MVWKRSQDLCDWYYTVYRSFKSLRDNAKYKAHTAYLNYAPQIQGIITTNWIGRINLGFRRVTQMSAAKLPNEELVITLPSVSVAMKYKTFDRLHPKITTDKSLLYGRQHRASYPTHLRENDENRHF